MKKNTLILASFLCLASCYTYKTYDPEKDVTVTNMNEEEMKSKISSKQIRKEEKVSSSDKIKELERKKEEIKSQRKNLGTTNNTMEAISEVSANINPQEVVSPKTIIKEKGYYQLEVFDKSYKMEAVKWNGDTIVGFVKGKPKQELKFHQKDIQNLKVRQFSKARSDAFTVASYAAVGVGIFLLLK